MKYLQSLFLFSLILFACKKEDVEFANYSEFRSLNDTSLFSNLTLSSEYDYYELRNSWCNYNDYKVVFSKGQKCADLDSSSCAEYFNSIYSDSGFTSVCHPSCCYHYFVKTYGDQIEIYNDPESVISFLYPIDTQSDALMVAFTNDYGYAVNDSTIGGIRKIDGNYQLILLKTVSLCNPIQTNKYLIEINSEGDLKVLKSDVYEVINDACY